MVENSANWPPEVLYTLFNILLTVVVRLGELRTFGVDVILSSSKTGQNLESNCKIRIPV